MLISLLAPLALAAPKAALSRVGVVLYAALVMLRAAVAGRRGDLVVEPIN